MPKLPGVHLSLCGWFYLYISRRVIWLRFGRRQFELKRGPLMFSERNGWSMFRQLPFGWRLTKDS